MPYKTFFIFFIVILAGGAGWFLGQQHKPLATAGGSDVNERQIKFYQCSMDPQITSDKPGKCTICGMNLAPIYDDANENQNVDFIKLTESTASVIGVASTPATVASLHRTLRVTGIVADDETRHRVLSARVPGRIEKLYVNQVGIEVIQKQPLAEIYSPDLLTAQRLYLENLRVGGAISISEIASSREKLLAYGLEKDDITKLEQTQQPKETFAIRAPFDGTVVSRKVFEGQYVNVDDELFEIGDFATLWFIFDTYERDLPMLRINQQVTVTLPSLPGENLTAPIEFIDPNLNEMTRTARVRVVLPNPQRRILNRQTANGLVHLEAEPTLIIPRSALLFTHDQPAAYVDLGGGAYQFRQLELGRIGDNDVEIRSGIKEGEKVVTQAALLIDSQSQLAHLANTKEPETQSNETSSLPTNSGIIPSTLTATLPDQFIEVMFAITSALSSDNLAEYQKQLPILFEALKQTPEDVQTILKPFAEKLVSGKNLKEARTPFEPFSNMVADIVRKQPPANRQAKIFQCPMSPVLGTARWIQKDNAETRNPFFGSEMYNCGVELQ
ncbi:MAG: efflux RND transporter periplasmic adaptor subunit [Planctomycetaceae bacterium]|jgi:Cu(I)/Ag(I) efflux system membrane fusion protein|nr:efflux RND transporter periplasmic adaptor subunit [Planctomycetaceae bacterium]